MKLHKVLACVFVALAVAGCGKKKPDYVDAQTVCIASALHAVDVFTQAKHGLRPWETPSILTIRDLHRKGFTEKMRDLKDVGTSDLSIMIWAKMYDRADTVISLRSNTYTFLQPSTIQVEVYNDCLETYNLYF